MDDDPLTARLRAAGCVFAEEEAALLRAEAPDGATLESWAARRVAGEPLEAIVGWAAFDGLRVPVAPGVFVPRQRSLLLVDLTAAGVAPGDVVLDLCCGAGALGAAVAARVPGVEVWAADADPAAVACAARLLPPERVRCGDLFDPLPPSLAGTVVVVLCNAPYVPSASIALMPREAREHEAMLALDGGTDGLALHRRVLAEVGRWLRPGGLLVTECAPDQVDALAGLVAGAGLRPAVYEDDERGAVAVTGSRRPD